MPSAAAGAVRKFRIADIVVPENRKRSVKGLQELTNSIRELGLLNPIILTQDRRLVAGLHRLRACEALGWKEISAVVLSLSQLDAELVEIDENLCRTELTVLEQAEQTARRKQIYQARHPETRKGAAGAAASNRNQGRGVTPAIVAVASFVDDTSTKTGKSKRGIERAVQIAEGIAPEVRDAIRDSPLADRVVDLVSLSQVDPKAQAKVAARVVEGGARNVADAVEQLEAEAEAPEGTAAVVRDQVGQELSDPEIAEAYTELNARIDAMVLHLRAASRAWGKHFHAELIEARKLRFVEAKEYMSLRPMAEQKLRDFIGALQIGRPYALCPYCKGEPLGKNRLKYCKGCGGGGWVDRGTYESAPPELQVPGTGRKSRERYEVEAEVGHE